MPKRTHTAHQNVFTRPAPSAVTYDLSTPDQATIKLPPGSQWTSGPHWHDSHTEFLQVTAGHAELMLSDTTMPAVSAIDGVIIVPRGAIHEWRRSQTMGLDEELVVKEVSIEAAFIPLPTCHGSGVSCIRAYQLACDTRDVGRMSEIE